MKSKRLHHDHEKINTHGDRILIQLVSTFDDFIDLFFQATIVKLMLYTYVKSDSNLFVITNNFTYNTKGNLFNVKKKSFEMTLLADARCPDTLP